MPKHLTETDRLDLRGLQLQLVRSLLPQFRNVRHLTIDAPGLSDADLALLTMQQVAQLEYLDIRDCVALTTDIGPLLESMTA